MGLFTEDPVSQDAGLGLARAIALCGLRTPSLKEIGETMNASVPSVHRWLGGGQEKLARVVGAHLGVILRIVEGRVGARGAAGFIPCGEHEMFQIRTLLAFEEIARSNDSVAEQVAEAWQELRVIIANALRQTTAPREVVILRGLWASICDGHAPMELDQASRIWEEALPRRGGDAV